MEVNPDYMRVPDIRRWVELHRIKLVNREGRVYASIPTPCSALTDQKLCGIYDERPEVCRVWPMQPSDLEDSRIKPFCTLRFEETADAAV
jgi:Fe-S-cluster containining protein